MGRKHCWKRRRWWLPAFSPFPTMFSKGFFFRVVKSRDFAVKILTWKICTLAVKDIVLLQGCENTLFGQGFQIISTEKPKAVEKEEKVPVPSTPMVG